MKLRPISGTLRDLEEFNRVCCCVIASDAGQPPPIDLDALSGAQWAALRAEHDRLGRPLDMAEVLRLLNLESRSSS